MSSYIVGKKCLFFKQLTRNNNPVIFAVNTSQSPHISDLSYCYRHCHSSRKPVFYGLPLGEIL